MSEHGMGLGTILLIGGGGYLIYSYLTNSGLFTPAVPVSTPTTPGLPASSTPTVTSVSTTGGSTGTTTSAVEPASYYQTMINTLNQAAVAGTGSWDAATVAANKVYAAGGGNPSSTPLLTVAGWNYYYSQVAGHNVSWEGTSIGLPDTTYGPNNTVNYSSYIPANTYLAALQTKGLSGLGRTIRMKRGIGRVAQQNPWGHKYGMGCACENGSYGFGNVTTISQLLYQQNSNPTRSRITGRIQGPRSNDVATANEAATTMVS